MPERFFVLGVEAQGKDFTLPEDALSVHGVVLGSTGSGKTGFLVVLMEEALINGVPVVGLDVKGDLSNLGLSPGALQSGNARAELFAGSRVEVYTPGHVGGRPVALLGFPRSLEEASNVAGDLADFLLAGSGFQVDRHFGLKRLLEKVILYMVENSLVWEDLPSLLLSPPFRQVDGVDVDSIVPRRKRREASVRLASFIGSPAFGRWLRGEPLDFDRMAGEPGAYIFYLPHLSQEERETFVAFFLKRLYAWMLRQGSSSGLRLLLVFDEVYGYLPPYPRSSPAKEPLLSLIKQGRAFGVSVFLSTQNPYDIDYRALGNARLWVIGRLQTSNDRKRVLEGVREASPLSISAERLADVLASLKPREFAVYDAERGNLDIVRTRDTYSRLAGPLTLEQVLGKIRTTRTETQVSTPVKDNLLLLPPQVEGLEEYFIRNQKHSEIIKELEKRGLKVKSIVSAYYEPLLVVEAKLTFTGSRGSLHVTRLVELAHLAEKPSFLEASNLGLKIGELESLPLDSSPTPGYRFIAPSLPLDEKSIERILKRFSDELGKTSYRLYECVETGEISDPLEDLASFVERQTYILALKKRRGKQKNELDRIIVAIKREYEAIGKLEAQLSDLKREALIDSLGKVIIGRTSHLPRKIASTIKKMRSIEKKIKEKEEKIARLKEEAKRHLEEAQARLTVRETYMKPSQVQVHAKMLLWVPVVEVEIEKNGEIAKLKINAYNLSEI
ncbi:ATP-binding protein [Thermofilum sp.]|jgi:DNA helicase HerA-like ATPase|uniref:ATP-binding protein n=1 Tax=Thermofilum sp. TaxID=1961369 RepID=UPI00258C20D0|nr:ATP-binding protein [Thermofilum sp.]